MDLNRLSIFSMMSKRMSWLAKRQDVLAQNVANADTPGFKPHDLKAIEFKKHLAPEPPRLVLARTSPQHSDPTRTPPRFRDETQKDTYETTPAGNAVVIEEQLTKVAETQADHRLALNLYGKHIALIKTVLGRDRA